MIFRSDRILSGRRGSQAMRSDSSRRSGESMAITAKPTAKPILDRTDRPVGTPRGLEYLSWLMDRAIRIPGTNITVGLDALLGLLPVGGDFLTGIVQVGIVLVAMIHYHVPKTVAVRMAANVLLDILVGAVPVLGDAFDVFFKANTRNMQLLRQVEAARSPQPALVAKRSIGFIILIAGSLLGLLALVLIGFITVLHWIFKTPIG